MKKVCHHVLSMSFSHVSKRTRSREQATPASLQLLRRRTHHAVAMIGTTHEKLEWKLAEFVTRGKVPLPI